MPSVPVPTPAAPVAGEVPDYELAEEVSAHQPAQLKALADPTRWAILDLVLERAASVRELAAALGKPKSTVAHHVEVLQRVGLVRVVRTRKVRAVTEAFYGRTGRTILAPQPAGAATGGMLATALAEQLPQVPCRAESTGAPFDGFTLRHARIPAESAQEFFERLVALAVEFSRSPRGGEVVYGLIAGVYPTAHAVLPPKAGA